MPHTDDELLAIFQSLLAEQASMTEALPGLDGLALHALRAGLDRAADPILTALRGGDLATQTANWAFSVPTLFDRCLARAVDEAEDVAYRRVCLEAALGHLWMLGRLAFEDVGTVISEEAGMERNMRANQALRDACLKIFPAAPDTLLEVVGMYIGDEGWVFPELYPVVDALVGHPETRVRISVAKGAAMCGRAARLLSDPVVDVRALTSICVVRHAPRPVAEEDLPALKLVMGDCLDQSLHPLQRVDALLALSSLLVPEDFGVDWGTLETIADAALRDPAPEVRASALNLLGRCRIR